MSEHRNYDVIILGAGSIGTPAAFNLAQAGLKVLVIDEAASVGQGSNKKAIGGIRATHSDPAKIRLCQRSIQIFSSWKDTYGDEIEWYRGGYCFIAYRDKEKQLLQDLLAIQHNFHLNIEWLDDIDLCKLIPDLNPHNLLGGTYSPDDGSASPLLATYAFYRHARMLGAEFNFNDPIIGFEITRGKITGVKTTRGRFGADMVINATGPNASHVSGFAGVQVPVTPDSHEAAVTEPVARFFNPMIVDIRPATGSSNYYFYQHHTGQIFFCITPSPNIWGFDTRETSSFLPMIAKRLVDVMPRLKNIRVRRTWRGLYPMTPDGFPIVGRTMEVQGLIQAVGMCGQGFMLGPGLAELLVRLVLDKLTPDDEETLKILSPYREFGGQEKLK